MLKSKQTTVNKHIIVYLVVANTRPPTLSLTQSERDDPSEDGAWVVLRREKSGAFCSVPVSEFV